MRRLILALAAGLLLFAGHPPLDWGAAGLLALAPLTALGVAARASVRPGRAGFGWGVLAGLVFHLALLEWVARFGVAPWILLSLLQALFTGAYVALVASWRRAGLLAVAPVAWAGLEALRGRWPLGGLPWGQLGYSQHDGGLLLEAARTVGVLGVTTLCAAVGVCAYGVASALWAAWRSGGAAAVGEHGVRAGRVPLASVLVLLVLGVLLGVDPPAPTGESVEIAAIQGNDLPDTAGVGHRRVEEIARRVTGLTRKLAASGDLPDVVVWPENSLDADVRTTPALRRLAQPALEALGGTPVLAGMLTDGPSPGTFLNTVALLEPGPRVVERYVKQRIVPFGEYVPGRRFLGWIPALEQIPRDAVPGREVHLFDLAGARIGVPICFENIFPEVTRNMVRAGADVLVVSTNNASYGFSSASRQHVAFSRVRAVETGRWILHAGINGISAVVDPDGQASRETELFEQAIVRAELPLLRGLTPAMRVAPWVEGAALAGLALLCVAALWDRFRRPRMAGEEGAGYAAPHAPVI